MYSCLDQPSQKSLKVNQWINKNGECSPKQTKQEVLQEQSIHITDHWGSVPQNDDLQKLAERSTHQFDNEVPVQIEKYDNSVASNVLAVEIEESDKSIAANDLVFENQDETPFVFKCRPIEDLIDGDSEPIPETNSAGTSVRSESSLDDDSMRNSTSEDIGNDQLLQLFSLSYFRLYNSALYSTEKCMHIHDALHYFLGSPFSIITSPFLLSITSPYSRIS